MVIGECTNGEDAVEAVSRLTPSVVIMDVNMPRLNGVEATALIKRNHPRVVVLGISIYATEIANQAMIKAGAEILISKGEIGEQLPYEIFKAMNRR
jgi:DNA-binding NarL/FixJ family response regulator